MQETNNLQVEETDQLRLDNLNLRFTNMQLVVQNINQRLATLQGEAETMKEVWRQKYGADFQQMKYIGGLTWQKEVV